MRLSIGLFAIHVPLFADWPPFAYALTQGVIDAGTCVVIYFIAGSMHERYSRPSAIAAIVNPTQIVLSEFFYTDTAFAFFVALSLLATMRWMAAPSWCWTILLGFAIGVAALVRVLIVLWIPFLGAFLLAVCLLLRTFSTRMIAQAIAAGAIVAVCLAPTL